MTGPIHSKVRAATVGSFGVSLLTAFLNAATGDCRLLAPLPPWAQALVISLTPPVVTFLAGWQARHAPADGGAPAVASTAVE